MRRQQIGLGLVWLALLVLLVSYALGLWWTHQHDGRRLFAGGVLLVLPLLYFVAQMFVVRAKTFVALALLAPLYLFYGGVVWIWGDWRFGAWLCGWAVVLQVGAILHNFQRRAKRKVSR